LSDADHKPWNESSDGDGGTLMAQHDDFGLIKQIVAAGGHKQLIAELDRDKISAPGRARLVEGLHDNRQRSVLSSDGTRPSSCLALLKFQNPSKASSPLPGEVSWAQELFLE